jgi:hypothetical protein
MATAAVETKAAVLLTSGRVHVRWTDGVRVVAEVHGDSGWHEVRRLPSGRWTCTCPAHARWSSPCSHREAVKLVTEPGAER